jgi:hypothetical protein
MVFMAGSCCNFFGRYNVSIQKWWISAQAKAAAISPPQA